MLLVFLSWHGYFPKFCFYWIMETKSWSTMIGTFGFQVFRGTPNFHSFHFLRSSKDALAHTKDASIRACLSKLSGADAQSKPVRPEDYSVLFVACSSVDAWAPVLGCSEAPEKSCCNCLSLGKWKRRHFLMVLMLNELHSLLQPVDSDWTTHTSCTQLSQTSQRWAFAAHWDLALISCMVGTCDHPRLHQDQLWLWSAVPFVLQLLFQSICPAFSGPIPFERDMNLGFTWESWAP